MKQREPEILASLVNRLRRRLILEGSWPELERAILEREPALADWFRDAERNDWVPLEGYLHLMQHLLEVVGEERLALYGSQALRDDLVSGPLSPMLRAWLREFATDGMALLRMLPHAWNAVVRNAGRMIFHITEPGRIVLHLLDPAPSLLALRGWPVMLEGFGRQLLEESGRQGSFSIGPDPDGASLRIESIWSDS
jgi:hypothetical protein